LGADLAALVGILGCVAFFSLAMLLEVDLTREVFMRGASVDSRAVAVFLYLCLMSAFVIRCVLVAGLHWLLASIIGYFLVSILFPAVVVMAMQGLRLEGGIHEFLMWMAVGASVGALLAAVLFPPLALGTYIYWRMHLRLIGHGGCDDGS
jgi:hypothetical protein